MQRLPPARVGGFDLDQASSPARAGPDHFLDQGCEGDLVDKPLTSLVSALGLEPRTY
jgi:hypothetical protein